MKQPVHYYMCSQNIQIILKKKEEHFTHKTIDNIGIVLK